VLAAIVAMPCTAPFMGAAIGYALAQPPLPLLAVFLSLGLGLALPYLLLTWWPSLQRRLPRPGPWMDRLKQLLAFPMYLAAVWLLWVLAQQAGADAVALALVGIVAIALAAWVYQNTRDGKKIARRIGAAFAAIVFFFALAIGYRGASATVPDLAVNDHSSVAKSSITQWENYSAQKLADLRADGKPVFVNFTAAWCISCLVNEREALQQQSLGAAFKQQGITYLKGDWTNQDSEIAKKLAEFGRSGVPLYLFFPRGTGKDAVVLPQILTPDIVLSAIAPTAVVVN
ncbi:MAG: thioredoxin family protein, partial [Spongiibacteraceae bacterium]